MTTRDGAHVRSLWNFVNLYRLFLPFAFAHHDVVSLADERERERERFESFTSLRENRKRITTIRETVPPFRLLFPAAWIERGLRAFESSCDKTGYYEWGSDRSIPKHLLTHVP